ncbi:MAG TPA: CYTH and CHAD domain-containing protein [Pilimelia sp.]|nr:CYTH and CHAD domain-containing protein [Pilimelia sp.]
MDVAVESERPYDLPAGFTLPELAGAGGVRRLGEPRTHELDATYLDTEDLRLARSRMTLRRRTGGADPGWHLKTPGRGDDRTEHRLPLADEVPAELLILVRAVVRDRPVVPVARLRTRRREHPLLDDSGRVLALLALDEVTASVGGAQRRWQELEVELVEGDPATLEAVDAQLRDAGATPARVRSKLARALGDALSVPDAGPTTAGGPRPAAAARAVVAYARDQRDAIVGNDPAVRRGEPKAVHAMRVATRRLRSTLRTFRGLWEPRRAESLRIELAWLADRLGGVRDRQVMVERLRRAVAAEPAEAVVGPVDAWISDHLGHEERQARDDLNAALDDARYFALLDTLDALVAGPVADVRGRWVRRRADVALRRADRLLDGALATGPAGPAGSAASDGPPEPDGAPEEDQDARLHRARRAVKRARYAVEALASLAGAPARRLAKRLTALQDVLGEHQDAIITQELLRDYAVRVQAAGGNTFTYGLLYARQRVAATAAVVDRLPGVRRASRRPRVRRWLS